MALDAHVHLPDATALPLATALAVVVDLRLVAVTALALDRLAARARVQTT